METRAYPPRRRGAFGRAGEAVLKLIGLRPIPELNQTLSVHLPYRGRRDDTDDYWAALGELEKALDDALILAWIGDLVDSRLRAGRIIVRLRVHDADAAFTAIEPVLKAAAIANGGHALKWPGDFAAPGVTPARVAW